MLERRAAASRFLLLVSFAAALGSLRAQAQTITEFPAGPPTSYPWHIVAGPDGNLWFSGVLPYVGRVTTAGTVTLFPMEPGFGNTHGITAGPDGNLWFTLSSDHRIGRIAPEGVITAFPLPSPNAGPYGIAAGRGRTGTCGSRIPCRTRSDAS